MTTLPLTLATFDAYIEQLRKHDWYYHYSDDGDAFRRGNTRQKEIDRQAAQQPMLKAAKAVWEHYVFGEKTPPHAEAAQARDTAIAAIRAQLEDQLKAAA